MKRLRQVFKISLAKIFFVANYVICLAIFDWDKFFRYLNTPAKINCHIKEIGGSTIEFCCGRPPSIFDPIIFFAEAIFFILTSPSIAITEITLEMFKKTFPLWCLDTRDIIYIPIFAVINSFYWISLVYCIELAHAKYLQIKPPTKKPLSIFPD